MTLPKPPSSIAALIARVQAEPAPLIFLDTCAILDILRSFHRDLAPTTLIPMTLRAALASSATPPQLHLLITEQVSQEYANNLHEPVKELGDRVARLSDMAHSLLSANDALSLKLSLENLEDRLTELTGQVRDTSFCIATEASSVSRAALRLANGTAPAKRGSSNLGDCLVIEHFLEFIRAIRANGFTQPCIFVSSNHKDFGRPPNPKPPLDAEFASLSVDYLEDFSATIKQLGL